METLCTYTGGWHVVGDDSTLAIAFGDGRTAATNTVWDLSVIEDDTEREVEYAELLNILLNAQLVDTEVLSGIAVDVTDEFDWYDDGRARALYTLKSEDTDNVYAANSDEFENLVSLLKEYTEEATDNESETA